MNDAARLARSIAMMGRVLRGEPVTMRGYADAVEEMEEMAHTLARSLRHDVYQQEKREKILKDALQDVADAKAPVPLRTSIMARNALKEAAKLAALVLLFALVGCVEREQTWCATADGVEMEFIASRAFVTRPGFEAVFEEPRERGYITGSTEVSPTNWSTRFMWPFDSTAIVRPGTCKEE